MAMVGASPQHVAPPRARFSKDDILSDVRQTPEWAQLSATALAQGMSQEFLPDLTTLLVNNLRSTDGAIDSKQLKSMFVKCGLSSRDAAAKIRSCLLATIAALGLAPGQANEFYEVKANGHLTNTRMQNVTIKRDGITEILLSGQDPVSIRIRQLVGGILRVVEAQLDKAKRYEDEHRHEEVQRLASSRLLLQSVQNAMGGSVQSAQGRVRQFAADSYDALGFVDRSDPGFATAKNALVSVATPGQLTRRKNDAVADNLTRVGKYAVGYINGAVAQDITNALPQINAATTQAAKKRVFNNALRVRAKRVKRFHMFHEDPAMVGVDSERAGSQFVAEDQAHFFLNQEADKNSFV